MKKCPYCAEEIQPEAIKCKHCGEWLESPPPLFETDVSTDTNIQESKSEIPGVLTNEANGLEHDSEDSVNGESNSDHGIIEHPSFVPRPWVRYFARTIDLILFAFLFGIVMTFTAPSVLEFNEYGLGMLIVFNWIFVEASLLSTLGTTPGKCLLRVTVRGPNYPKMTFGQALKRSFGVWWYGMGTGFPLFALFTLIYSHRRLTSDGVTFWDRDGNFSVSHQDVGPLRTIAVVLFFLLFGYLQSLSQRGY